MLKTVDENQALLICGSISMERLRVCRETTVSARGGKEKRHFEAFNGSENVEVLKALRR